MVNGRQSMTLTILHTQGTPDLAEVFVARFRGDDRLLAEFVDARDPTISPDRKWIIIVSTQFGCPVACPMCDAGGDYCGDLTADEILSQVDCVIARHPPGRLSAVEKFKVQFARMGEPALNSAVIEALEALPRRSAAPGLIPCIATTAPARARDWFDRLLDVRHRTYAGRLFQLQLSINATDEAARDRLMPVPKLSLPELGNYAQRFFSGGPRKVALNFALAEGIPVDPAVVAKHFDPASCCIKITPLNPTARSAENGLATALLPETPEQATLLCAAFERLGFDVILSIGDVRENALGSNCGMAVQMFTAQRASPEGHLLSL